MLNDLPDFAREAGHHAMPIVRPVRLWNHTCQSDPHIPSPTIAHYHRNEKVGIQCVQGCHLVIIDQCFGNESVAMEIG